MSAATKQKRARQWLYNGMRDETDPVALYRYIYDQSSISLGETVIDRIEEWRALQPRTVTATEIGRRAGCQSRSYQQSWYWKLRRDALNERRSWNPQWKTLVRIACALSTKKHPVTPFDLIEPFK